VLSIAETAPQVNQMACRAHDLSGARVRGYDLWMWQPQYRQHRRVAESPVRGNALAMLVPGGGASLRCLDRLRDAAWYAIADGDWPAVRAAFKRWPAPENFDAHGSQRVQLRWLASRLL
jgi:hypothetical protein